MGTSADDGTILALEDVVSGYGKLTVLNGTSFTVARGAITTIIGPNGAGKSTVFRTVFGLLPVQRGRVVFDGRQITNFGPGKLLELGISYVPQGRNLLEPVGRGQPPRRIARESGGRIARRGLRSVSDPGRAASPA